MGGSINGAEHRHESGVSKQYRTRLHEAEHRHRNVVQLISSLVRAKLREVEEEESRESLNYVLELVDTLAKIEGYLNTDGESDIADRLRGMAAQWQHLCNGQINIIVDAENGISLTDTQCAIISVVALELVLNAIKHGFPDSKKGTIGINLMRQGPNSARLAVEDDGAGAAASATRKKSSKIRRKGQGNQLVQSLVNGLGGVIEQDIPESGSGHRVAITWPL